MIENADRIERYLMLRVQEVLNEKRVQVRIGGRGKKAFYRADGAKKPLLR